jgi:hypothetical protein
MADVLTVDPDVVIEADVDLPLATDPVSGRIGSRSVTYRSLLTGRRWTVLGICDRRGDCMVGAVVNGVTVTDKTVLASDQYRAIDAKRTYDVPVTPEFAEDGCCPFAYLELPRA